jgi:hypothetical protein
MADPKAAQPWDAPQHLGRKGSLIGQQYAQGERIPKDGVVLTEKQPTNEEVAKAVQQKVAVGCSVVWWREWKAHA